MDKKMLIPVIAMVSVVVMFIWSWIEGGWSHSWLAVMIGGICITIVSMMVHADESKKDSTAGSGNKDSDAE